MPDSTPKPLSLIQGHRTKADLAVRAAGEQALTTAVKMQTPDVVKGNKTAEAHWRRLIKVLGSIGMDEALYENVLGRYCVLLAEHEQLAVERAYRQSMVNDIRVNKDELPFTEYLERLQTAAGMVDAIDRQIAKKRDQLLAIERENLLTVQGKLRAIPKKAPEKAPTGIQAFRMARGGGPGV